MKSSSRDTPHYSWIILVLLLAGCSGDVYEWQINSALEQCKERGGVDKIDSFLIVNARCRNGAWVTLQRGK